jgi:predicted DCC family thiol-disulfide oxidoreductase YuxK
MKQLTVLYDAACGFCVRCRWWLAKQPQFVPLEFIPSASREVALRFPGLGILRDELAVVADDGAVYRGTIAWIMCLWALVEYRELAMRMSNPLLMPLARRVFELVSANRRRIARWLGVASEAEIAETLRDSSELNLQDGACPVCRRPLGEDVVQCDRCRTPHHAECWRYAGDRCSTFGCGGAVYRRTPT